MKPESSKTRGPTYQSRPRVSDAQQNNPQHITETMSNSNPPATQAATAVARRPESVKDWLNSEPFKAEVARALPSVCKPERFLRVALTAMTKTPKLAECTPHTVLRCFLDCAALGIEPDNRRAYLIPFKDSCTLVIGYQGLLELARRSGEISRIHADVVCENDVFEISLGEVTTHKINLRAPRGDAFAFFAIAVFKDGAQQAAVMTIDEVCAIRDRSNAVRAAKKFGKETPWDTDFVEMGKKTVLRRLCKMLPLTPEAHDAIERDDEDFIDIDAATPRQAKPAKRAATLDFGTEPAAEAAAETASTEAE